MIAIHKALVSPLKSWERRSTSRTIRAKKTPGICPAISFVAFQQALKSF
jgi:hypothetical protein